MGGLVKFKNEGAITPFVAKNELQNGSSSAILMGSLSANARKYVAGLDDSIAQLLSAKTKLESSAKAAKRRLQESPEAQKLKTQTRRIKLIDEELRNFVQQRLGVLETDLENYMEGKTLEEKIMALTAQKYDMPLKKNKRLSV